MYKFFFTIFRRNLARQWINIAGLSIGLTVVLLICAFIFNEFSFDHSFTNHQRIYRVNSDMTQTMIGKTLAIGPNALAPAMKEEIPEVEAAVRIFLTQAVAKVGDAPFKVEKFCWADEDFFRLFDTPFVYGSPAMAFSRPNTVAVSESEAKVLFGDRNPLGETVMVDNKQQMEISAVYRDFPANSSFGGFQMVGHYMSSYHTWIHEPEWGNFSFETYCMLVPGADVPAVENRMQPVIEKGVGKAFFQAGLQPLTKVHLYSKDLVSFGSYASNPGDVSRVKIFSLLAIIVMLVACINYMNLSTARAQKRSKEIGISKTLGAKRKEIILRLYSETGLLTFLSFVLAFLSAYILLPVFNSISGQDIHPGIILNPMFLLGVLSIYIITTFVAASYPALYLSGFAPLTVIRQAAFSKGGSHAMVRKGLTIVQFAVAVILIAWVIVIRSQVNYMARKDIGYDAHNVVGIPVGNLDKSGFDALKNDYSAQGSVTAAAFSQSFPFSPGDGNVLFKTMADMDEARKNETVSANSTMFFTGRATPGIIDALRLKLIAGTTIPERKTGDSIISIIVNRKAVEYLETTPEEIIGKRIPVSFYSEPMHVCGVVEDFNFKSLHEPVGPYGFYDSQWNSFQYLLMKVNEGNISQQLAEYEQIFKKHFPNDLFEPQFPSVLLTKAYEEDRQTSRIVLSFSILAILVACMGVFGLTAFMAEQRTKEIGIRKVLGASVANIVRLFTDSYLRLLLIALVVAIPIVWWISSKYLENFAYRISLAWWMFATAALITVVLTLLTVGVLSVKAATANPVKAIKSE